MTFSTLGYWEAVGSLARIYTMALVPDANKMTTLTWVAPKAGHVRINLRPRKPSWTTCGDGVWGGVYKNLVLQHSFEVTATDVTGTAIQLLISVQANDKIQFQLNRKSNTDCDNVIVDPTISYTY